MANLLVENKEIENNSEDISLEETLPIDPNVGLNLTKVSDNNKINIFLKATSDVPIMKRTKWRVEGNKTVHQVVTFLKKILKFEDKDTLFLYVSQAFSPSPDQQIKNLYDCFGSEGKLVLHYSKTPAWG